MSLALGGAGLTLALFLLARYPLSPVPTLLLVGGAAALWQRSRRAPLLEAARRLTSRPRAETG